MDNRTERLVAGVWRVEVGPYTNAYVLANDGRADDEGLTVVDTGGRNGGPRLVRSIRMLGFDPRAVRDVLLSSVRPRHAGSAARFAASSARSRVHMGAPDIGPPDGGALPDARPLPLHDRQRLATAGGVEVLHTPGPTPGHCAFWLPTHGIVLAGDLLANVVVPSRGPRLGRMRADHAAALERLAALDVRTVAVGHGPPVGARTLARVARDRRGRDGA